jgi:hypothetical protein
MREDHLLVGIADGVGPGSELILMAIESGNESKGSVGCLSTNLPPPSDTKKRREKPLHSIYDRV